MSKVNTFAKVTVRAGTGDEFAALFPTLVEQAGKEPDTLLYVLNRSAEEPDVFWFFEVYTDEDARTAHGSSEFMAGMLPKLKPFFESLEVLRGIPVAAKGVDI